MNPMDQLQYYFQNWGGGMVMGFGMVFGVAMLIWSIYWKGMALWHAVKSGEKIWFIALLIINTAGILEILYLYFFSKNKQKGLPKLD